MYVLTFFACVLMGTQYQLSETVFIMSKLTCCGEVFTLVYFPITPKRRTELTVDTTIYSQNENMYEPIEEL